VVRRRHRTGWVIEVCRPTLLHGLGNEQRNHVDEDHKYERYDHIAGKQEKHRTPDGDGVVVPKIGGHEDVGRLAKPPDDLEKQTYADERHADVGGIGHRGNCLPTDIKRRLVETRNVNHLLNKWGKDRPKGRCDECHTLEADPHEDRGLEGALARCLKNAADDVDDNGNGDVIPKGIKYLLQYCEEPIHGIIPLISANSW